ncbi:hypothetical protein [Mycobacterium intracellulare]|uniref:hypothetical protein n=1 Tax=Mycobacterium intracellulare TaxID=1767 RepID=UPI0006CA91F8|nr:hypothetical protein [Mycobacterium intracellulare]KPN46863.1 hypothetical protein AN933_25400 [Mycobacterium intracellulare subsp. chimaera]
MSIHTEWGHARGALYTLHTRQRALEELRAEDDDELTSPFVLGLWNENGDGLALCGTRRELLDYLALVAGHVTRETDPRLELDQALQRLNTLRAQRATALAGDTTAARRIDEQEIDLLIDLAEAAAEVNDQL